MDDSLTNEGLTISATKEGYKLASVAPCLYKYKNIYCLYNVSLLDVIKPNIAINIAPSFVLYI